MSFMAPGRATLDARVRNFSSSRSSHQRSARAPSTSCVQRCAPRTSSCATLSLTPPGCTIAINVVDKGRVDQQWTNKVTHINVLPDHKLTVYKDDNFTDAGREFFGDHELVVGEHIRFYKCERFPPPSPPPPPICRRMHNFKVCEANAACSWMKKIGSPAWFGKCTPKPDGCTPNATRAITGNHCKCGNTVYCEVGKYCYAKGNSDVETCEDVFGCHPIISNCATMLPGGPPNQCPFAAPLGKHNFLGDKWNDNIVQIDVNANSVLTVYTEIDFGGEEKQYLVGTHYIGACLANRISSYKCELLGGVSCAMWLHPETFGLNTRKYSCDIDRGYTEMANVDLASILCTDGKCNNDRCCERTCETWLEPNGFLAANREKGSCNDGKVARENGASIVCPHGKCTNELCCGYRSCATYSCGSGYVKDDSRNEARCEEVCDDPTCCMTDVALVGGRMVVGGKFVCGDQKDDRVPHVFCKTLGYVTGVFVIGELRAGESDVLLMENVENVKCTGLEGSIRACIYADNFCALKRAWKVQCHECIGHNQCTDPSIPKCVENMCEPCGRHPTDLCATLVVTNDPCTVDVAPTAFRHPLRVDVNSRDRVQIDGKIERVIVVDSCTLAFYNARYGGKRVVDYSRGNHQFEASLRTARLRAYKCECRDRTDLYEDHGQGKCVLRDGEEVERKDGDWHNNASDTCQHKCDETPQCGGYSWNSHKHCLLYFATPADLKVDPSRTESVWHCVIRRSVSYIDKGANKCGMRNDNGLQEPPFAWIRTIHCHERCTVNPECGGYSTGRRANCLLWLVDPSALVPMVKQTSWDETWEAAGNTRCFVKISRNI